MRSKHLIFICATLLSTAAAHGQTLGTAVPDAELSAVSGKADIAKSVIEARNTAVVSNNSIAGVSTTGGVTIDGSAFQNLTGLAVISANTGNNVVINSSLNVNVTVRP